MRPLSRSLLTAVACASFVACAAPQQPGLARTSYATMATVQGAALGAGLGVGACSLFAPKPYPTRLGVVCGAIGAVAGGTAALVGTLETENEPSRLDWAGVVAVPAFLVVGGVWYLIQRARAD